MRKILFFACSLLMFTVSYAQERITDFENYAFKSPHGVQFLDTLNKRILVFVTQPEQRQQQSLWSSDGTLANTKILKDEFGESASPFYGENFKIKNYRYLKGQHIWRTDGEKLERIVSNSDSLSSLQKFNNKPLLIFRKSETIDNQGFYFFTFTWLDSLKKVNVIDRDIVYYQIIDSTLHYLKLNKQTKFFELHNLSGNKHYKSIIPVSQTSFSIHSFEIFTQKDADFYFLNTSQGKKLFSKKRNDTTDVTSLSLIDWGSNQYNFPWVLKDEFKKTYFANYNSSINNLKIYALTEQNTLVEQWSIQSLLFFPDNNLYYGQGFQVRNMSIISNKIVFNSTTGSEGINAYYFNVFDIKKNTNRKSRNLGGSFGNLFYTMNVTQKDSNTYELDNRVGTKAIYSFLADSVIQIINYPYRNSYIPDSLFTINNQKILLSDNIFNVSDSQKKPLIPEKTIFAFFYNNNFLEKILGDKLLFWRINPNTNKTELWVSDGEKKGTERLIVLDDYFEEFEIYKKDFIKILNGKLYFYTYNFQKRLAIYETDGTRKGTSKIFESDEIGNIQISEVKANNNQIVFQLRGFTVEQGKIIVIQDGKAIPLTNIPTAKFGNSVYITSTDVFIVTHSEKDGVSYNEVFRQVDDRLLLVDKDAIDFFIYKDRLFYTKTNYKIINGTINFLQGTNGIHYIDQVRINTVTNQSIDYWGIYGNKLVYRQFIAENKPYKHTIIDLSTNNVDLVFSDFYSYGFESINDVLVISNNKTLRIIKNRQLKEYNSKSAIRYRLLPFDKGFLIQEGLVEPVTLTYYDLMNDNTVTILTNTPHSSPLFNKSAKYLLIPDYHNNVISWKYWTSTEQKLIDISNVGNFFRIDSTAAFASTRVGNDYESSYWNFDGKNFYKSYVFPMSELKQSNNGAYFSLNFTKEMGEELIQLCSESISFFPEIVKGSEGITLGNVFHFKNQLYVYAFTYLYGWQVWKMGEVDNGNPLATEEIAEQLPILFPNPVQDNLQIDSQQKYHYRVINIMGQEVLQGEISPQGNINFSKLTQGLYIIQFFDGAKTFSKKIMKN